jgi:hypothetical protein
MQNAELTRSLRERELKLKEQQSLYEKVRADSNLYNRQHIQSLDAIAEVWLWDVNEGCARVGGCVRGRRGGSRGEGGGGEGRVHYSQADPVSHVQFVSM